MRRVPLIDCTGRVQGPCALLRLVARIDVADGFANPVAVYLYRMA